MLLDLSTDVESGGNKNQLIYELMSSCILAATADGGHLYLMDKDTQVLILWSLCPTKYKWYLFRRYSFMIQTELGIVKLKINAMG